LGIGPHYGFTVDCQAKTELCLSAAASKIPLHFAFCCERCCELTSQHTICNARQYVLYTVHSYLNLDKKYPRIGGRPRHKDVAGTGSLVPRIPRTQTPFWLRPCLRTIGGGEDATFRLELSVAYCPVAHLLQYHVRLSVK